MQRTKSVSGTLHVENIGGIDESEVEIEPGITILAGRNATNRTSLLKAIMAAMGSDRPSLKAGAQEGQVTFDTGSETYTRQLRRNNNTVIFEGESVLDEPSAVTLADLFSFLLESNEARRAVTQQQNLRELIMRPVDTEAIKSGIQRQRRDRDRIDEQLDELERLANRLPSLESQRQEYKREIDELEAELEEKRDELEEADRAVEPDADSQDELDAAMSELQAARSEYNRIQHRIETERESVTSLEEELEDLEESLTEFEGEDESGVTDERIERLREQQNRLDSVVRELQSVIDFNATVFEDAEESFLDVLDDGDATELTGELLPSNEQEVPCWTCGSTVQQAEIGDTLERLRDIRQEMLEERSSVRAELEELTEARRKRRERRQKRRDMERRIERTEEELEERREKIPALEADLEEREAKIDELETTVEELQEADQSELLDLNKEVNELEFELEATQEELEALESEISEIESRLEERDELETERERVAERLEELRNRIETIETDAIEQFNDHIEEVLSLLEYENIERIWIERKQSGDTSRFELHVIRTDSEGTALEDSINNLSESEREMVGLVFALAGYLVHNVYEQVPVMLLDSLEAFDSERIAILVEYFAEYAESVIVALLPEDAQALDEEHRRIEEISV